MSAIENKNLFPLRRGKIIWEKKFKIQTYISKRQQKCWIQINWRILAVNYLDVKTQQGCCLLRTFHWQLNSHRHLQPNKLLTRVEQPNHHILSKTDCGHCKSASISLSTSGWSLLYTSTVFNFVFQLSAREVSVQTSCRSQNWKLFGEAGVLEVRVVGDEGSTENCIPQSC